MINLVDHFGAEYLKEFLRVMETVDFTNNPEVIDTFIKKGEYLFEGDLPKDINF